MLFCHDSWMGSQFAKKTREEKDTKKCEKKERRTCILGCSSHRASHGVHKK